MSQGLTWIAGRRIPLLALVALLALAVGLFAVLQSVSAAACAANPDISLGDGETCEVVIENVVAEGDVSSDDTKASVEATPDVDDSFTITGVAPGTATITFYSSLGDNDAVGGVGVDADTVITSFDVTVLGFGIKSAVIDDESDNVVKAGAPVTVRVTLRSDTGDSTVRLVVPTTGLSIAATGGNTTQAQNATGDQIGGTAPGRTFDFTINTAGAPDGTYTLTATADANGLTTDNAADGSDVATATIELTIGDAGTGLAAAELALGNSANDVPYTADDETKAETGSAPATSADGINLVITVTNSLGEAANSSDIDQITVIAPGGTITSAHLTGGEDDESVEGTNSATLDEADDAGDVGAKTVVNVTKADDKPGVVTVYALVLGPGGAATTESIDLTFTGPADSIEVLDATQALRSVNVDGSDEGDEPDLDTVKLQVTASDASGLDADAPTSGVAVSITDADGKRVASTKISASQPAKGDDGKYYITVTGKGSAAAPLAAGEYTVTAKRAKLEGSGTFVVAGAPDDVTVTADPSSSDTVGDIITVSVVVSDADGNAVANGTTVTFTNSENTGLAAIGTGHKGKATKAGSTSVKYAVVGAGTSVISATAGDATGVAVITSTAGVVVEEPVVEEPVVEAPVVEAPAPEPVDGLTSTELNNFSTWIGEGSVSGSELLAGLADATGLWYYDGNMWWHYGMDDGQVIPGSRDFSVRHGYVIWISE